MVVDKWFCHPASPLPPRSFSELEGVGQSFFDDMQHDFTHRDDSNVIELDHEQGVKLGTGRNALRNLQRLLISIFGLVERRSRLSGYLSGL